MFSKLNTTNYPPSDKPLMVYDGKCGFCKYWVIKWMKVTRQTVDYKPYQEIAQEFKDIPLHHFKEAVRYIGLDGRIISGPDAAYITYYNQRRVMFLHRWYHQKKWFRILSDYAYQWIADHRNFMSTLSIRLFGKNPANPKPYWKLYLALFVVLIFTLVYFL